MIFFDRDGTLNCRLDGYVTQTRDMRLLPGAAEAVAIANTLGRVVVVTNQQGIGRALMTFAQLDLVHAELRAQLAASGAHIDAIYVCPHLEGTCSCRKPGTGLFLQALADAPEIAPHNCVVIGDKPSDLRPGLELGMQAIHVLAEPSDALTTPAGAVTSSTVLEAVDYVRRAGFSEAP